MSAFYNENDPKLAAWLRELINHDLIAPGVVDERSIEDIIPGELAGYTQCHFFAGIGVWSYALRQAGWPDDKPVWTGSCPCQPFSTAGKREGVTDERHLWPALFHLIQHAKRRDVPIFGEQVDGADGFAWLDIVQDDMEGLAHTCWPFVLPAAGVGAPHIRHRQFFVAQWMVDAQGERRDGIENSARATGRDCTQNSGDTGGMADSDSRQRGGVSVVRGHERNGAHAGWQKSSSISVSCGQVSPAGPTNGFWSDSDWLCCRDGKWRPVRSGSQPLVDGAPARVVRLRGYGNAINAEVAKEFISAYMAI